jgi:Fe-S-cluster containining protein
MLDCPPGKCGLCCKYPQIHVSRADIKKITDNTEFKNLDVKEDDKGNLYMDGSNGGCPFLRDNICIIWPHRPFICSLYPIQGGRPAMLNGRKVNQMLIRLNCLESIKLARKVIDLALRDPQFMLLPDLSVVQRYKRS